MLGALGAGFGGSGWCVLAKRLAGGSSGFMCTAWMAARVLVLAEAECTTARGWQPRVVVAPQSQWGSGVGVLRLGGACPDSHCPGGLHCGPRGLGATRAVGGNGAGWQPAPSPPPS
jgi:hypothetical protein